MTMHSEKKKRLGAKGWRVGSAGEFLGLSTQEQDLIDLRLRLADGLKRRRLRRRVTQAMHPRQRPGYWASRRPR
jgi:hypothetical protein